VRRPIPDEDGAVLPMLAILLVVLLMSAALAVDLGMQRVVARDMQALADVVALDMARLLDGQTARGDLEASGEWAALLADTLARNDDALGRLEPLPGQATATPRVEAGRLDQVTGDFVSIDVTDIPNAVQVTAAGSVAFAFAPVGGGPDRGAATRAATAVAGPSGCFRLGSFALGLDTASAPLLGPILDDALNITAVGYGGLATSTISLGDLAVELGAGTPEQLVDTTADLRELYLAGARILEREGDAAAADILEDIAFRVPAPPVIVLGQLLAVGASGTAALGTRVNVLDLVSGSAFIANGSNAIAIPPATIAIPGVTNTTVSLTVVQRPIVACNDAVAETSQVQLTISGRTQLQVPLLDNICVPLTGICTPTLFETLVDADISLTVDLATARGTLDRARLNDVHCAATDPPRAMDVAVFDKTVSTLDVAIDVRTLGGIPLASATALTTTGGADDSSHVIDLTTFGPDGLTDPVSTGSGDLGLEATDLDITLLNLSLLDSAPLLRERLGPLLTTINNSLRTTIGPQLGLVIAGADIWGVDAPECTQPVLRG
jgi:uncharacterized membrane protein